MPKKVTKAVIAAAGLGTRFLPMTKAMPKEMLPIIDKPIIQYVVEEAVAAGITDIIIVGNANKRVIEDHFDHQYELETKLDRDGKTAIADELRRIAEMANFVYVRQKPLYSGNGTPVLNAAHLLNNEPFLVLFADDFFRSAVPRAVQLMEAYQKYQKPVISLVEVAPERAKSYGVADINRSADPNTFELKGLIEKPSPEETPLHDGKVFASVAGYIMTPDMMRYLETQEADKSGEIVLANAINRYSKDGNEVYGRVIEGQWHDAGNKEKYLEAIIDVALSDSSIAPAFKRYLEEKLAEQA